MILFYFILFLVDFIASTTTSYMNNSISKYPSHSSDFLFLPSTPTEDDSAEADDDGRVYKNPRNHPSPDCPRDEEQATLLGDNADIDREFKWTQFKITLQGKNVWENVRATKIARVRRRNVCATELAECPASNPTENARNFSIQVWERSSCQAEPLDHVPATPAITAITSLDSRAGSVRRMVIGRAQNQRANRTSTAWHLQRLSTRGTQHCQSKRRSTWIRQFSITVIQDMQQLVFQGRSVLPLMAKPAG